MTTQAGFAKVEPRKIIQESERQLSNRKGTAVIFPGDQDIALQVGQEIFYSALSIVMRKYIPIILDANT